jgi:hypothetical protein
VTLRLKRETKYASPGADQQHFQIVFDDGQVRRSIGRVINVLMSNNRTVFRWGIMRIPSPEEDRGEAPDLESAMAAVRRRWNAMTDEIRHIVVHQFGREVE